jgi:hypothetical protein
LEQWKARLPIGTPFDPFHFIDEPLDHPSIPGLTAPVGHGLRIVGESVNKLDQFRDPAFPDSGFPLLQARLSRALAQEIPKVLCEGEDPDDRGVTLRELIEKGDLIFGAILCRTNDHERGAAGGRRFAER